MKFAGLTWWRGNYGSILQAYALQQEMNHFDNIDYEIICQYGKKVASVSNLKEKLKRVGIRNTIKRIIFKFGLRKLRARNIELEKFTNAKLCISEKQYNEQNIHEANSVYDGFICGSDQIWNPKLSSADSMYWLNFAEAGKKKIAYAPSIGVNSLSEEESCMIRKNLCDYTAISCREESGTQLINKVLNIDKCITVLDPTLMIEREVWDNLCTGRKYSEPYIFVYILRGTKKQRQAVEKYAKRKQLKIVTMPFLDNQKIELYDFKFGDIKLWDASPADFISVIRYAEYVFTDSFHCMVFSCLYHRPFFAFPKIGKAQMNRLTGLQELFQISSRFISEETSVEEIEEMEEIKWSVVEKILKEKRIISKNYLKKAIFR